MRNASLTVATLALAVTLFGFGAHAQQPAAAPSPPPPPPPYGPAISIDQAKKVAAAAVAEAKQTPYEYAFAIVNPAGQLVYFERTDDVITASLDIAIGKARTSATLKRSSKAVFDQMESGHTYISTLFPGIVAAAGGVPIMINGKIVGAIGVSGSPTGLIDEKAALAGAAAVK